MDNDVTPEAMRATKRAMQLVKEALDLLDAAAVLPQTTSHLEMALAAMRASIGTRPGGKTASE
jgi:hypothetical protein